MCRALNALVQSVICLLQVLIRVFMTVLLMAENLVKMVLQTVYNFVSFLLQMLSLVPICLVFLVTSKLKCLLCGSGGGICPVNRGSGDCIMTGLAFALLFFIFRWTGFLDKIFYNIGYAKIASVKSRPSKLAEELQSGLAPDLALDVDDPETGTGVMFLDNENMLRDYEETETETETTETSTTTLPSSLTPTITTLDLLRTLQNRAARTFPKNISTTVMYYLL